MSKKKNLKSTILSNLIVVEIIRFSLHILYLNQSNCSTWLFSIHIRSMWFTWLYNDGDNATNVIEITCRNRSKREHYGYDIVCATGRRLSANYIIPERHVPPLILMHARFSCNPFLQGVCWRGKLTGMLPDVAATHLSPSNKEQII